MKILQVINLGYPAGGAEASVQFLKGELESRGHEVKVFSSDQNGPLMFSDYQFKLIPQDSPFRILHHLFYFRSYQAMRDIVKKFRPDLIHFHVVSTFSPSVFYAIGNIPAVMTIHGPDEFTAKLLPWFLPAKMYRNASYELQDLTTAGKLRFFYHRHLQRPIYLLGERRIRIFIAPSKYLASAIVDDVPKRKILQIHNGIDLPVYQPLPNNQRVLYVGRIEEVKGVRYLVQAFLSVLEKIPQAELHVVGDGTARNELENIVKKSGFADRIIFRGWVRGRENVMREYANASIVIVPSIWPENFPTVCIEALSTGRPVIGTETGGVPELIKNGENGYIIPPRNSVAIAETIINFFESGREKQLTMSRAATQSVKQFNLKDFADTIEKLYKKEII